MIVESNIFWIVIIILLGCMVVSYTIELIVYLMDRHDDRLRDEIISELQDFDDYD